MQKKGKTVSFLLKSVGMFGEMKDAFEINLGVYFFSLRQNILKPSK